MHCGLSKSVCHHDQANEEQEKDVRHDEFSPQTGFDGEQILLSITTFELKAVVDLGIDGIDDSGGHFTEVNGLLCGVCGRTIRCFLAFSIKLMNKWLLCSQHCLKVFCKCETLVHAHFPGTRK